MIIGLVGNQNSGKTTLFNYLTGMNSKIGNWPGVTIEKKTGFIKGTSHEITDLPGIYSLSPYTSEEEVSRNYIFNERPDVIINIIDATSLERSLYLTTQLLELDCKIIVALNMVDILSKKGISVDINKLSKELGTKVIPISALKGTGVNELINSINSHFIVDTKSIYDSNIENSIFRIENSLPKYLPHKRFISVKLLERDEGFLQYSFSEANDILENTSKMYDTDLEEIIATQRYSYIERLKKNCTSQTKINENISDKIDKILLNKWIAFPIFILVMFLVYFLSVGVVGSSTVEFISNIIEHFKNFCFNKLNTFGVSEWVNSLIVNGIISGVGAVFNFIPELIILFLCISVLETSGYMSRIALLLDKVFRKIGLSGKSLIPFIVGSGCSVPGIMTSKIIENEDEKKMTTILTPFIPCSAKLPIIALFSGAFFKETSGFVSASVYFLAIAIIIFSSIIMKKFVFKNSASTYISELPDYKVPSIKYVAKDVFDKVLSFIKRAGSVILLCSIVIWFLLSFSCSFKYGVDIENSILATLGNKISWIFFPILGTNSWGATVSAIQGLVAKEQVISSMAVINGLSSDIEQGSKIFAEGGLFSFFTSASAYAFMVFNLFSAPCFGAISAMKKELGSTKEMLKAVIFQTVLAWILATIIFQIGSRLENGTINFANLLIIGSILCIVLKIISSKFKHKNSECSRCPYYKSCDVTR